MERVGNHVYRVALTVFRTRQRKVFIWVDSCKIGYSILHLGFLYSAIIFQNSNVQCKQLIHQKLFIQGFGEQRKLAQKIGITTKKNLP